jgi:hypothetical protein
MGEDSWEDDGSNMSNEWMNCDWGILNDEF